MDLFISIALCILLLSLAYYLLSHERHSNLPPGPKGWPIVGLSLEIGKEKIFLFLEKLMKRYGEVVLFYLGMQRAIMLNSAEAIKEAYVTKGDNFIIRVNSKGFKRLIRNSGILFTDGPVWKEHRRFSLKMLKDFGFGRNRSEEIIHSEMIYLFNIINDKIGKPLDSNDLLTRSVSNVICVMTMGERPGYEDEDFAPIIAGVKDNIRQPPLLGRTFMLDYLPFLLKLIPSIRKRNKNVEAVHEYIRKKIQKHKDNFDPDAEPEDLTDIYLREQMKLDKSNEPHTFTDWQLFRVIHELFLAGTDTTSNTLTWLLLIMTQYPQIQAKVRQEIDNQIGRSRLPTMKDRLELPYVCAVVDEVMRFGSIVPMINHWNIRADTIRGYSVPAKTLTVANIYGVHHDPKVWKYPNKFYPEHFLSKDGKEYVPNDNLIPFSIGKRSCLGESLAKMEAFLFFVGFMQKYEMFLNKEDEANIEEIMEGQQGIIRPPGLHKIVFKDRQ